MTRIGALKGITRKETRQLRGKGIRTIDGLWARIGQDLDEGIGRAVEGTDIELGRLKELLAAQSVREGKKGQGSWPRQHWIEIVSVLAVAVLAALVLYTLVLKPEHPLANQVVVKADAGLPALQVIGPDDVGLEEVPQESGAFQKPSDVVGRYPLEEIPSGSTLRAAQLGETSLSLADLEDRYLLSIPLVDPGQGAGVEPDGQADGPGILALLPARAQRRDALADHSEGPSSMGHR